MFLLLRGKGLRKYKSEVHSLRTDLRFVAKFQTNGVGKRHAVEEGRGKRGCHLAGCFGLGGELGADRSSK